MIDARTTLEFNVAGLNHSILETPSDALKEKTAGYLRKTTDDAPLPSKTTWEEILPSCNHDIAVSVDKGVAVTFCKICGDILDVKTFRKE